MFALRCGVTRTCRRALSDIKATGSNPASTKSSEAQSQKPQYAIKANYDKNVVKQRLINAEEGTGQMPTEMQKRFLVLTKLYAKKSDIPEYVARGTMARMHNRMRAIFIVVAVLGFSALFHIAEGVNARRTERDKARGVVVTKM